MTMDLATHQRKLKDLIRFSPPGAAGDEDPYVRSVALSRDLVEARTNILLWRVYVLERSCVLTFRLLKQRLLLEEAISSFIATCNISPFRETQAPAFLDSLRHHDDPLVVAVARFERALLAVRSGDRSTFTIPWDVDPASVLHLLALDRQLSDHLPSGAYTVVVSQQLPFDFQIDRVGDQRHAASSRESGSG